MKQILALILVVPGIFLAFPQEIFAQSNEQILLSEKDSKLILKEIQLELTQKGTLDFPFLSPEEQVGIFLARDALRKSFLDFLPGFVSTETVKIVLNLASEIRNVPISTGDLIGRLESLSVKEATKIGLDWLSQNQIMISSGGINGFYDSYWGNKFSAKFQYLITYKENKNNWGDLILEFYSADPIDPPAKSTVEFPWESGDWLRKNKKSLEPFMIRLETKAERSGLGWIIDSKSTIVAVTFPNKVPKLDLSPELPYPLEEQKISLLNKWFMIKQFANAVGFAGNMAWQKIQKAGNAIQNVVGEIESLFSLVSNLTHKDTGAGIVLQTDAPSSAKADNQTFVKASKQSAKSSAVPKNKETKSAAVQKNQVQKASDGKSVAEAPPELMLPAVAQEKIVQKAQQAPSCSTSEAAPQQNAVILNEIAWAGTPASASNEWIELKNISSSRILLEGWQITDKDESIKIVFDGSHAVGSQDFFLLERTDDLTVPNISADLIYKHALGNTKEALYLFDENCVLRDKVVASPNWPAGDSALKKSMERGNNLGWHTYNGFLQNNIYGTPKAENTKGADVFHVIPSQLMNVAMSLGGGGPGASQTPTPTPTPTASLEYKKILISEIQTEGISAKDEFIELYNPNEDEVDLTDWILKKKTSSGTESNLISSSAFSGKIAPKGYFLIAPQDEENGTKNYVGQQTPDLFYSGKTYSVALDNTVLLYDPRGSLMDKVGFGGAQDFEGSPAQNPASRYSIGRKSANAILQDSDDNSQDFEKQVSTPKFENKTYDAPDEEAPVAFDQADITPPSVVFDAIAPALSNTNFILSWSGDDLADGSVSPSGIDSFYLQYAVTPEVDGIFLSYENAGSFVPWQQGDAGELTLASAISSVSMSAQDGIAYEFALKAKDKAGNISESVSISTSLNLAKSVVINEIAWTGTKSSSNDEWLELFNSSDSPINLAGWKLKADDGSPSFTLTGIIGAKEYYLLERTNDSTINDTVANQIYTGALGNNGEFLRLYDAQNNIIDAVDASSGWFAGDNTTKQSMERIDAARSGSDKNNWLSNNLIKHNGKDASGNFVNGTPKQQNSVSVSRTQITDLRFSEFGNALTLPLRGSPYFANGIIVPENATLTVEPGVTLKLKDNYAKFTVQGTLKAVGSASKGIMFTTDGTGVWCALSFTSTSKNSDLEYVTVDKANNVAGTFCPGGYASSYAMLVDHSNITFKNSSIVKGNGIHPLYLKGSDSLVDNIEISGATYDQTSAAVFIEGGSPTIQNSTFSGNSLGIYSTDGTPRGTPIIKNNTFTQNTYPIRLGNSLAALSGNSASGNTYNGIFVASAILSNTTWQADLPYIINQFTVNAGKTLILQPGVVIKFINSPYEGPVLNVQGTLLAQGTAENPVTFTALSDDSVGGNTDEKGILTANWRRIYFAPGSTGSILQNTIIKYGGDRTDEGMVWIESLTGQSSDLQLQNIEIDGNILFNSSGIVSKAASISGSNVLLKDNKYGFNINGACPILSGVTIQGGASFHPSSVTCSF